MAEIGITLAVAAERLQKYLAAETQVLAGQAYDFADGRKLTRANLAEIRDGIAYWQGHVDRLNPNPAPRITPRAVGRARRGVYRGR